MHCEHETPGTEVGLKHVLGSSEFATSGKEQTTRGSAVLHLHY